MGHERVGHLPKSKAWVRIVGDIGQFASNPDVVADVAYSTTKQVRQKFLELSEDHGVVGAFKFLMLLSHSTKLTDPYAFLNEHGVKLGANGDLLDLSVAAKKYIEANQESREYSSIATQCTLDTITDWFSRNTSGETSLFPEHPLEKWKKASSGSGFSEISRLFFSSFTKRYLRYFLEREAAWKLKTVDNRIDFNERIDKHIETIAVHAFETSKITQSFSAGWYNKHVQDKVPTDRSIKGYVSFGFKKINSELLREEEK